MMFLFRVPFLLLELLLRRLLRHDEQEERFAPARASAPVPAPEPPRAAVPTPTAEEAIHRRTVREAATEPPPPTPLRPIGNAGHLDEEAELVESFGPADDVGATLTVEEPWNGYAQQPAAAIVARLRGADPAVKAVVALYERGHKNRATVLRAAG
jgi:hypothetical protein